MERPSSLQVRTCRVVDAKDAGRLHVPAHLSVALSSVEVDGKSYDIETSTIGKTGENHNTRNLGFIGGGAAGGLVDCPVGVREP